MNNSYAEQYAKAKADGVDYPVLRWNAKMDAEDSTAASRECAAAMQELDHLRQALSQRLCHGMCDTEGGPHVHLDI